MGDTRTQKTWSQDGWLEEEIRIVSNKLDGVARNWHPNGKLRIQGYFENCNLVDKVEFYDENGEKYATLHFASDKFTHCEGDCEKDNLRYQIEHSFFKKQKDICSMVIEGK